MIKKLFVFLIFLTSCSPNYDYSHIQVVKVIDGDTIKLADGKLLRYIGIDTPEIKIKKNNRFSYSPQPFSLEAKEINSRLVANKFIRLEFDVEKTDKYGRLLGYCFVDGIFVNAKMIEEGYAVIYTMPPNVKYADDFIWLQRQARKNKKGLWGAYEVIDANSAQSYLNQIRTVKGRVTNTYKSAKCIFLNFGANHKKDFTVVIYKNSLKAFYDKGINPLEFYKGKTVEVSGRIRQYKGPEIIVNSPSEIEIVN